MSDPASVLIEFALAKLEDENLATRAALYRALASLTATPAEAGRFAKLADECDALGFAHAQLSLAMRPVRRTRRATP